MGLPRGFNKLVGLWRKGDSTQVLPSLEALEMPLPLNHHHMLLVPLAERFSADFYCLLMPRTWQVLKTRSGRKEIKEEEGERRERKRRESMEVTKGRRTPRICDMVLWLYVAGWPSPGKAP